MREIVRFHRAWSCLFLLLVISCGSQDASLSTVNQINPSTPPGALGGTPVAGQSQEIERVKASAATGKLFCPFSDECNPSLALISIVTDHGLERCSGVLISDTEVLTNDHCVNKSISLKGFDNRKTNLPCRDFVYAHFAGNHTNSAGPTLGCESIEYRSGETGIGSVDYAVIKLQGSVTDRTPSRLSKRGFTENEAAHVFRVQMTNDGMSSGYNGMQSKLDCQASYRTFLYPSLGNAESSLMTFGDCAIQPGNSGSPVFNENGEVGAIIQGYLTVADDPQVKAELKTLQLDEAEGTLAIGTQSVCMPTFRDGRLRSCRPIDFSHPAKPTEYLKRFGRFSNGILPRVDRSMLWHEFSTQSPQRKNFVLTPQCSSEELISASVMTYRLGINRKLQAEWRPEQELNEQMVSFQAVDGTLSYENSNFGRFLLPGCGTSLSTR